MATLLTRPVTRIVEGWCKRGVFGLGAHTNRPLVVTLMPGGIIRFREKGRQKYMEVAIESCYNLALKAEVESQRREKAKRKRMKKRGLL